MTTAAMRSHGPRELEPKPGRWERRFPGYRYGVVLVLLVATYVVEVAAPDNAWSRLAVVALEGLTLLLALAASRVSRVVMRVASVAVGLAFVAGVAFVPEGSGGSTVQGSFLLVNLLLVAGAPVAIVRSLVRRAVVDVRTILGALCVYVLIGMTFAFGYGVVGTLGSGPFFAQEQHATNADYLYFSYITQTTVGYGDLTPAGGLGRALAVLEALSGQIYLVTVVALLVGSLTRRGGGALDAPIPQSGDATVTANDGDIPR